MRDFWKKTTPPGMNLEREMAAFIFGLLAAVLLSLGFVFRYSDDYVRLFTTLPDGTKVLAREALEGRIGMEGFLMYRRGAMVGFPALSLVMLGFGLGRRRYFRQGSRSDYLMRRLPQRGEYGRRVWLVPVLSAVIVLLVGAVILFGYWKFYLYKTPMECLPEHLWWGDGRL